MANDKILAYVNGELNEEDTVAMFQEAINSGIAWQLEGSFGRAAMDMIRSGQCMLGEVGHRDYWGNYVPSRTEVKPGTMGSPEYVQKMNEER